MLEKFRRDLMKSDDPVVLRDIGHSLLSLYFHQQEAVESLINEGWLPDVSSKEAVQKDSRQGAPLDPEGDC